MKTFCDDLKPVEVELISKDGTKETIIGKFLTLDNLKELDVIMNKHLKNDVPYFDVLCEQLVFVFGGVAKEYSKKYSVPLLRGVMDYVKEIFLLNPLLPKEKGK